MTSDHDQEAIGRYYTDYTTMYDRAETYRNNYEFFQAQAEHNLKKAELLGSVAFTDSDEAAPEDPDALFHRYHWIKLAGLICKARTLDAEIDLHKLEYTIAQHTQEARKHYLTHADQYYDEARKQAAQSGIPIITEN